MHGFYITDYMETDRTIARPRPGYRTAVEPRARRLAQQLVQLESDLRLRLCLWCCIYVTALVVFCRAAGGFPDLISGVVHFIMPADLVQHLRTMNIVPY